MSRDGKDRNSSEAPPADATLRAALEAQRAGRATEAGELGQAVLRAHPGHAKALHLLGLLAMEAGDFVAAIAHLEQSLESEPEDAKAWSNLGTARRESGRHGAALEAFRRALELAPNLGQVAYNIGLCLKEMDRPEAALGYFERAVKLSPGFRAAPHEYAETLRELGRFDEALVCNQAVLQRYPDYARAHLAFGIGLLMDGRFEEGWEEYEWRLRTGSVPYRQAADAGLPDWDGSPLGERRLLVLGEQAPGDQIMFASILADIEARPGAVTATCDQRLLPLFARSFPDLQFAPQTAPEVEALLAADSFDCGTALGSLGRFFRRWPDDFPSRRSFLKPDPERVACLRERYVGLAKGRRLVGFSWRSWSLNSGRRRNLDAAELAALLRDRGCLPVSLQYGVVREELERLRSEHGIEVLSDPEIDPTDDLDDLAALIAALDLVVSIDNTTIHLAGAVGAPTLALLSPVSSWRWMIGREDSPWYPSLRLLRQQERGDRGPLIARLGKLLETGLV